MKRPLPLLTLVVALFVSTAASAEMEHALGFGYRYAHIESENNQVYDFHSPALGYSMFVGQRWGFLMNLEIIFPTGAFQDGDHFRVSDLYASRFGGDVMLMAAYRFLPGESVTIAVGLGPHLNGITLSDPDLVTFKSLTIGLGAMSTFRYRVHQLVDVGANLTTAIDFGDLINRANRLSWAAHFSVLATVGVHF